MHNDTVTTLKLAMTIPSAAILFQTPPTLTYGTLSASKSSKMFCFSQLWHHTHVKKKRLKKKNQLFTLRFLDVILASKRDSQQVLNYGDLLQS